MSLRFNTFRSARYLRTRFVEGRFLLASENTDLELEIIDQLRQHIKNTVGDIAIKNAWKVQRYSDTELLVSPGEAWVSGIPFIMRSGKDQLVSGDSLSLGITPVGVTISDEPTGLGKLIAFNSGGTTPTDEYRIVITAREEAITNVEDPFLKNANLAETTAQKIRLTYKIDIVSESDQNISPIPYTNDTSDQNLTNKIIVNPTIGGNGELISITPLSGSEQIDGRDLEIILRNDPTLGGGNPIPNGTTDQQAFFNGKLLDSLGNQYHINAIFNDTVSTQVVIRLDKEVNQPNPTINNGSPITLLKRDIYVTDDINGSPQGKLFYPIAKVDWHQSLGIVHDSRVSDLRKSVDRLLDYQDKTNIKYDLRLTGGGDISFEAPTANMLQWSADLELVNPHGLTQNIPANTLAIMEGGSVAYDMNVDAGGVIARGNLAVTAVNTGTNIVLAAAPDLSLVRLGNIFKVGSELKYITAIDDVSKTITIDSATSTTGAATIYRDSFAPTYAPLSSDTFILAVRKGDQVYFDGALELESGEINDLGDGISVALLAFIGATGETDSNPFYTSTNVVVQGSSLVAAISALDDIVFPLTQPIYDERILFPTGLAALSNITIPLNSRNGNQQETYGVGSGELMVFHNQLLKFEGIDWNPVDNQTIKFTYDLTDDSEIHFRKGPFGGGSGGGSTSLQGAYNNGRTITTTLGNPIEINGTPGDKLLVINGDLEVTGVIDPTAIQFIPQAMNPLSGTQRGIWVNNTDQLIFEPVSNPAVNITQKLEDLESGTATKAIVEYYLNSSGSTIPAGTPVYSPVAGEIAPANGNNNDKSRLLGVTIEEILDSQNGKVAVAGIIENITGFTHNKYLYLDQNDGLMVDEEPELPTYSSGFNVVIVGLVQGTNLILRLQHVGRLSD